MRDQTTACRSNLIGRPYRSYARIVGTVETCAWVPPLLIRVSVGFMFLTGALKKLGALDAFTQMFSHLGVPLPSLAAPAVAWVELIGGAALMLGLATRLASVVLAIDMVGALITDIGPDVAHHHPEIIEFASNLFYSSEWLLLGLLVWLTCCGAGDVSCDHMIASRLSASREAN